MRQITRDMVDAFWAGKERSYSNSAVVRTSYHVVLELHGNAIARRPHGVDRLEISAAGWATNTTKERLNGLLRRVHGGVSQQNFVWYLHCNWGEERVQEMDTSFGVWTLAYPGDDLEQLAAVANEPGWND